MKRALVSLVLVGFCVGLASSTVHAVPNLDFEVGDFSGWTVNPPSHASVTTGYNATDLADGGRTYAAPDGTYFAVVQAGGAGLGQFTSISRTFSLTAGDKILGWAAFDARDQLPFNDLALAGIQILNNATLLYQKDVAAVGDFGSSPWESWEFVAPLSGDYTFAFGVRNGGNDNAFDSRGLLDLKLVQQVPDAGSTLVLLLLAGIGLVQARRRN